MKGARAFLLSVSLGLALFLCGCVTSALWREADFKEPSPEPRLNLYEARQAGDVLVSYEEVSDRNGELKRRAFYLNRYAAKQYSEGKPRFVDPKEALKLDSIPVFEPGHEPDSLNGLYAVRGRSPAEFALFNDGQALGSYSLPVYRDGLDQTRRVAVTPFAVVADAVIIGSVVGLAWVCAGGLTWFNP